MGNARYALRTRGGVKRPGPEERLDRAVQAKVDRLVRNEAAKLRQRARRARLEEVGASRIELQRAVEGSDSQSRFSERSRSRLSNKISKAIQELLATCESVEAKRDVLEGVLNHNLIWPSLPEYYPRPAEAKCIYVFLESYRTELQLVKGAHSKPLLARKGALLDAAVSEGTQGQRLLSRVLQVHPRNITAALSRRAGFDIVNPFEKRDFAILERAKRPGLTELVKGVVKSWWHDQSRVSPNKKDVTRRRVGPNTYVVHATHFLTETQTQLFLRFKESHPECRVKLRAFEKLKPWYVKTLKDQNTCCCVAHVEMDLMREGLNALRDSMRGLHARSGCTCPCEVCNTEVGICHAHTHVFERLTLLWLACVCPKGELDKWHNLECVMGRCQDCGVKRLKLCPDEVSLATDLTVKWKCFEYVIVAVVDGRKKKTHPAGIQGNGSW